jgi:hypothetical protein
MTMRNYDRWILLIFVNLSFLEVAAGGVRISENRQALTLNNRRGWWPSSLACWNKTWEW